MAIIDIANQFEELFNVLVLIIFVATLFILCFIMYHASLVGSSERNGANIIATIRSLIRSVSERLRISPTSSSSAYKSSCIVIGVIKSVWKVKK